MKCPRCLRLNGDSVRRCECGFKFGQVGPSELPAWFDEVRTILETAYLRADTPWQQSGKSGTFEEWTRLRIPVSECIDAPGTFLDIGCANGFLLECLLVWTRMKGVEIVPHGLDYSEKLVELARRRLPGFTDNLFVGNAWDWEPPQRFDYVRTELVYVPENLRREFVTRLLDRIVAPGGRLLAAQYRSRNDDLSNDWIDDYLRGLGFNPQSCISGFSGKGFELTRIAILAASEAS